VKNIAVLTVLVIILGAYSYAEENEDTGDAAWKDETSGTQSSAEENKGTYSFLLGPQFGFVYGQTMEYVYPNGETRNDLLSELTWDMKPIFYLGIQAQFSRTEITSYSGLFFSASFKVGIPVDSGFIEDRDWMTPGNSELTRFSKHTNKTDSFFWLDAAAGFSFPTSLNFYLKPFISGSWMRFSFTGRDGYGIYNDCNPKEQDFSGETGISYRQDWFLLAVGLSTGTNILSPFFFDLSFQISPLTYCAATDNHYLTDTVFRDITRLGLFLEPSFNVSLAVKYVEFSLAFTYRHIGRTKGESYGNEGNTGFYLSANKAGAGLSVFDSRFFVSIRF